MVLGIGIAYLTLVTVFRERKRERMRGRKRENESFDIFLSRIHQLRLNDPLSSYYCKTLKIIIKNPHYFLFII